MILLQIIFILLLPASFFWIEKRMSWFKPIVMAYVLGIAIGNIVPELFDKSLLHEITGISIILAIPLMLFPTHFKNWLKQPKTLVLAYGLAVMSTTISVIIGWVLFRERLVDIATISGMVEGVYTGGTVNLNAVAMAFGAPENLIVLINGYDMALSGIYLLGILTFLPRVLSFILVTPVAKEEVIQGGSLKSFDQLGLKFKSLEIVKGLGMAVLAIGVVAAVSFGITGKMDELIMVFGVTGLALVFSSFKWLREQSSNMLTADYLMIIFGFSLGLQANLGEMIQEQSGIFQYFLFTYTLMLIIHLFLARLFKVDVYSFLISSVAAVFGPPFIGPVAEALNQRNLITSGIIIALMGNAIGTYLGIIVTEILLGL